MNKAVHISWLKMVETEFKKDYFKNLEKFVSRAYNSNPENIFPKPNEIFRALNSCAKEEVKMVILGQDPYPTKGQAHGLCFSVNAHVKPLPKSLKNILKELESDLNVTLPNGSLQSWADQGVLLLNTVLTVEEGKAGSHSNQGWEIFTDSIIKGLSDSLSHVVYVLWGSKASEKASLIDGENNLILTSAHPSPLSAYRGFFGCKHFSLTNQYLVENGKKPIVFGHPIEKQSCLF
jgi:uracil-DNA glycosylase